MIKKIILFMASVITAVMLLMCSGCDFSTVILSKVDAPDVTLQNLFTDLKAKEYQKCDQYLADSATFVVEDDTDYHFMNDLIDTTMDNLSYETLEAPMIHGMEATQKVRIVSLDTAALPGWIKENLRAVEYQYAVDTNKTSVNPDSVDDVSDVICAAIAKYADEGHTVQNDIVVDYVFVDNQWKIKSNSDLVTAIFGGIVE